MRSGTRLLAVTVLSVYVVISVHARSWNPQTYPDPKRDVNLCGREGKKSNICDPDGILSHIDADRIEGILKDIWQGVNPYARVACGQKGQIGYQVAIALMRRMEIPPDTTEADAARSMAKDLHAKWGVGDALCDNGVLLLLAVNDRQIYISTGVGAQQMLSDVSVQGIVNSIRVKLRAQDYAGALEQAVVDIGLGLAGKADAGASWFPLIFLGIVGFLFSQAVWKSYKERRQYRDCRNALQRIKEEQEKLRTREWSHPRTCPICLEVFTATDANPQTATAPPAPDDEVPGPSAPLLASESGRNLNRKMDPAGMAANEDNAASTSEDASLLRHSVTDDVNGASDSQGDEKRNKDGSGATPNSRAPMALRCGHTFCEECLSRWFDRASTCPICRERVDDAPPPKERRDTGTRSQDVGRNMAQELLMAELAFRLMSLRQRYPRYITPGMVSTWSEEARSTGTFNWESARDFQLNDPAVRARQVQQGAGGNVTSFGGGGRSGGGGGAGGSW